MVSEQKLATLANSAKYDASCASSGSSEQRGAGLGNVSHGGICHSWSADGRCISLLKVLFSNRCIYDCAFCVNRRSNDIPRATFRVEELVELTVEFYRRNYIEGLFLSSGIWESPDRTMECLGEVAKRLRCTHGFGGYIHLKAIPGASPELMRTAGLYADRLSVNIELPSEASLQRLAPQKRKHSILRPMGWIGEGIEESREERRKHRTAPAFAPAGQSTQLVVGASPESDFHVLRLTESLYDRFALKRVYYSGYVPVNDDSRLPALREPPLRREHRLYQADWLLRFYGFRAGELLNPERQDLDPNLDPKTAWALRNPTCFPIEVNRASYEWLLRVPGIGVRSAQRICAARRHGSLDLDDLRKIGVVIKRAQFFVTCRGKFVGPRRLAPERLRYCLETGDARAAQGLWQPSLFPLSEPQAANAAHALSA